MRGAWPAIWRFRSIYANISAPRIADKQAKFVVETELFFLVELLFTLVKSRMFYTVHDLKNIKRNECGAELQFAGNIFRFSIAMKTFHLLVNASVFDVVFFFTIIFTKFMNCKKSCLILPQLSTNHSFNSPIST